MNLAQSIVGVGALGLGAYLYLSGKSEDKESTGTGKGGYAITTGGVPMAKKEMEKGEPKYKISMPEPKFPDIKSGDGKDTVSKTKKEKKLTAVEGVHTGELSPYELTDVSLKTGIPTSQLKKGMSIAVPKEKDTRTKKEKSIIDKAQEETQNFLFQPFYPAKKIGGFLGF